MRRTKLLICLFILVFHSGSLYLSSQTINEKNILKYENLEFPIIIDSLSLKFNVNFSYNADLPVVKKIKSVSCYAGLDDALKILLKGENLDYSIIDNRVVIFPGIQNVQADSTTNTKSFKLLHGSIMDRNSHEPLPYASVSISSKSLSTVANTKGEFIFRIPVILSHDTIVFSYIGYQSFYVLADSLLNKQLTIELSPVAIPIMEVIIKPYSGLEIVKEVVNNIPKNYNKNNSRYTAFYRETTREDNDYISICEAVIDIAKASYTNQYVDDQARIFKGRRSENVKKMKNLKYKLEGGVYNCLRLDVIKELASFLSQEYFDDYEYKYIKQMVYENRSLYVVSFDQKENIDFPLYKGLLYIDKESKALVALKFGLSPRGIKYAKSLLVKKEPRKFQVKPISTEYQIFYRNINGKWYLAYLRGELTVKAKSSKLFFNSTFTSVSEMAITEIDTTNKERFRLKETARPSDILVDKVKNTDENFWSNYIIIQPEKTLLDAVSKLNIKKNMAPDENFLKKLF
jgi:hypothetical protein